MPRAQVFNPNSQKANVQRAKPPRRSLLFVPADDIQKIREAAATDADCIVMDLEDSIALSHKAEARQTIVEALQTIDFGRSERLICINSVNTELARKDLVVTVEAHPDGYIIPKVERTTDLQTVSTYLSEAERRYSWPRKSIRLIAITETAQGIMNLDQIARASGRLDALAFGAEDLASNIGAKRTKENWEVFYARSGVVIAAAAYNLQAIDTVFVDLMDSEGLEAEALFAHQMGYQGKMAVHPKQVEIINRSFSPTPEEIAEARELVQAYESYQAVGLGVFEYEGKIVDMPMVRAAQRILDRVVE